MDIIESKLHEDRLRLRTVEVSLLACEGIIRCRVLLEEEFIASFEFIGLAYGSLLKAGKSIILLNPPFLIRESVD